MVLQALEGLSDREAIGQLRTNIAWKVAAGRSLDDEGFHPTVLTLWRNKLRASDRPQRIFDAVREVINATNVLRGHMGISPARRSRPHPRRSPTDHRPAPRHRHQDMPRTYRQERHPHTSCATPERCNSYAPTVATSSTTTPLHQRRTRRPRPTDHTETITLARPPEFS